MFMHLAEEVAYEFYELQEASKAYVLRDFGMHYRDSRAKELEQRKKPTVSPDEQQRRKERLRQEKHAWYVRNAARIAAKNAANAKARRLAPRHVSCATCGDAFTTAKSAQRFCRKECRWKWRHVEAA